MYTIFIGAILGIIIACILVYNSDWHDGFFDYFTSSVLGLIVGGAIGFLVAFALPMKTYEKHSSVNIVSLQDGKSISGEFFLGCGQINGLMKYTFYYQDGDSLYRMGQLDYNLVQIKYTDNIPILNIIEKDFDSNLLINRFAFDDIGDKRYIIEVPKGTIKNNYNLDLQ